jgi:hypothetical protein
LPRFSGEGTKMEAAWILVSPGRRLCSRADWLGEMRRLAWSGVPEEVRPIVWQLLLVSPMRNSKDRIDKQNYLPLPVQPRLTTLHRKRKEYSQLVDQYFGRGLASLDQQVRVAIISRLTTRCGIKSRLTCPVPGPASHCGQR